MKTKPQSTQIGRVYTLEYKHSLADSNRTASPSAAGNGGPPTLTESVEGNQRFYRG